MPEKPFREKRVSKQPKRVYSADKSEFEDKVHQELDQLRDRFKQLNDKMLNPKIEKNETEEKYAKDYKDISDKQHKLEKLEKERKDIAEVNLTGVFQAPAAPGGQIEQRIAALEDIVGRLAHFIPSESRPDLTKGALKQEPETTKRRE
jgi:predicted  nucleic acid-binding Zn-ribbon protein